MKLSHIIKMHGIAIGLYILLLLIAEVVWPDLTLHRNFSILAGLLFICLSFIITIASARLVGHSNPYYFSWVTMMSVLLKLAVGIGLVMYYAKTSNPPNKLYIIPFILSYILFTICEVYLLQQIIQASKKTWSK